MPLKLEGEEFKLRAVDNTGDGGAICKDAPSSDTEDLVEGSEEAPRDLEKGPSGFFARHKNRPVLLFLLQMLFCVIIPVLVIALCLNLIGVPSHARDSKDVIPKTWRLDTQQNYTIDQDYWHAQTGGAERHYYFNISTLAEVAPDGIVRNLTVINGQYPGPLIQANAGDTLFIHVETHDVPTTIHCHGLFFNKNNSYNDGAAYINQCPISADGGTYDYKILLDDTQSGTYWYHSHYGTQQADGIFGPLVIHSAHERELIGDQYDADVVIMANDYYHDMANSYLPQYMGSDNENNEPTPDGGLIQGTNNFTYDSATYVVPNSGNDDSNITATYVGGNLAVLNFDPKKKYRIRVINAGFFAPFNFAIDSHKLRVVEADGTVTEPLSLESIDISVAQRYSFILEPTETELTQYWMHVRFNTFCLAEDNPNFNTDLRAIVRYDQKFNSTPDSDSWDYNGGDVRCRDFNQTLLKTLDGTVPRAQNGSTRPDVYLELDVSFMIGAYQLDRGYFNDMTYKSLTNSSTMNQLVSYPNNNTIKTLGNTQIETKNDGQYLINLDKRGAVVDLVINNYDDGAHPFHLHGHKFWVLSTADRGYFRKSFYDSDNGEMDFTNPISRDVLGVSGYGYAVIRFVVDNPGIWPFHCHIGWHMESGLLLQVNELQSEYSAWDIPSTWSDLC
ncbi:LANO_0G18228g1_1 [Lachancea nothofagi CBS 11611]|uniref:LANO_0G18228g1_1 n=1 Tax=Lachancea nothofagi CBS 11611 TaxID=1266666 RepID=A0A1G4KKK0_9SACH|nr:LANO_0G18228g1_1 [Lachancea nothofagi CBS 11611]